MKQNEFMNDYELVYMYRQNNDLALKLLIYNYKQRIWKQIYNFPSMLIRQNRDELYHICILKLIDALDTYRVDKHVSFYAYYMRIVKNVMIDYMKSASRYEYRLDETTNIFGFDVCDERGCYMKESLHYDAMKKLPHDITDVKELIAQSDIKQKDVANKMIDLRMMGYTYDEIAKKLHTTKYAIDYLMRKIRRQKNRID